MEHGIKTKIVVAVLIVCMAFAPLSVFANDISRLQNMTDDTPPGDWNSEAESWYVETELYARQMGLNIVGSVPMLTPAAGDFYSQINQRIYDTTTDLIGEARRIRARSITFSFEMMPTPNMTSIIINASVAAAIDRTLVRSVNFSSNGDMLTIRDAMEFDIVPLAQRILEDRMHRSPENFYASPSVSLENQAFFVSNGSLTILFDEFQLSSMVSGVFPLEIRRANIRTTVITPDMLLSGSHAYSLMMVPLRMVAEDLGYTVNSGPGGRANVWEGKAHESDLLAWMYTGINEYHTPEMTRSLEAAPFNSGGRNFVPITFFEQILPLTVYHVDSFGNIIFLAYLEQ